MREKAARYKENSIVTVWDVEASVAKSDVTISEQLRQSLRETVRPLEDVPERLRDWHPGSDDTVLDLLHPSLFPLIYGVSRVLPKGRVPLLGCSLYSGKGKILTMTPERDQMAHQRADSWGSMARLHPWGRFQWLPSDVHFTEDGGVKITSYVNNLLPETHGELYHVFERFVSQAIPLWNEVLSFSENRIRIKVKHSSDEEDYYLPDGLKYTRPDGEHDSDLFEKDSDDSDADDSEDDELMWDEDYIAWKRDHRILLQREPDDYAPPRCPSLVDLRSQFAQSGLQIIFKLANIHLTPKKPSYEGGTWHVEGALNEHICATALYYADQENVTDSHLAFRQSYDTEGMTMRAMQVLFVSGFHYIPATSH